MPNKKQTAPLDIVMLSDNFIIVRCTKRGRFSVLLYSDDIIIYYKIQIEIAV